MRRLIAIAITGILAISLSGCGSIAQLFGMPNRESRPQILLGTSWSQEPNLKASQMIADLEKFNYCLPPAADFEAPAADTDYGKAWAVDQSRSCQDYEVVDDAPGGCQTTYYASVGKANLFDPKRSLIYEDSMSVLLLYGENWQLEVSPSRGAADPLETTVKNCSDKVQKLVETIGGFVNKYGDYK